MMKSGKHTVLFICLGNICRSPAAEGIMKSIVEKRGLSDKYEIDSAGIGNWHVGQLPDSRMRRCGAVVPDNSKSQTSNDSTPLS